MRPDAPRGFVLPTTLLVVTLLTVMLAAAFILVQAEQRTTDNAFGGARALAIAEAGLQSYFSRGHSLQNRSLDSTTYAFHNGFAEVVAMRLRNADTAVAALWVVRSTGYDTLRTAAGQPNGRRTVAQFAYFRSGVLPARAAMVAPNGVQMTSNGNNPIDGGDALFCSPRQDTTGLTVPTGGYADSSASGARPPPTGSPAVEYLASTNAVIDATHIDWAGVLAGQFTPDYTVSPPCTSPLQLSGFPSGYCVGDATLSGRRYGLLVVTGDVALQDGVHWDGIIVAGGRLTTPVTGGSRYVVHGMVITGMDGPGVPANMLRRGNNRVIRAASCYTGPSVASLSYLVPVKNTWVDTWSSY